MKCQECKCVDKLFLFLCPLSRFLAVEIPRNFTVDTKNTSLHGKISLYVTQFICNTAQIK